MVLYNYFLHKVVPVAMTALLWDCYMVSCSIKRTSVVTKGDISSVIVIGTIAECYL